MNSSFFAFIKDDLYPVIGEIEFTFTTKQRSFLLNDGRGMFVLEVYRGSETSTYRFVDSDEELNEKSLSRLKSLLESIDHAY